MFSRLLPACLRLLAPSMLRVALAGMPAFAADAPPLNEHQIDALKSRKTVNAAIHGFGFSTIPLESISKELKFEPGKVSLIPDPADSANGLVAVYLMNATDQGLWGADTHYAHCFLEVKDGNRWRSCERFIPGCGTGIPDPEDLQAGHATIFLGTDPNHGDMTGELRFCLTLPHVRPIVSTPFQGRFSSKRFEEAAPSLSPVSQSIVDGLSDMVAGKGPDNPQGRIARTPEELIAAAELKRSYDESSALKTALIRWQASVATREESDPCRQALAALLERPWNRQQDAAALFNRCFTALTRRVGGNMEFGSPERCRAMVWRFLSEFRSEWHEVFINPERWDQLEAIRQSGNPWGVDQKHVAALVEEASASLRSTDSAERAAAEIFLKKSASWQVDR